MMKERYTSPEMKILCFAPAEKLANNLIDFDDLLSITAGDMDHNDYLGATISDNDVVVTR